MSDHMDSGIKLFGRVIPLLPEAAQPGSPEAEAPADSEHLPPPELETPAPVEVEPEDRKDQHKETEDNRDSEMRVDVPEEKKNSGMKGDELREKKDNAMEVDAPQAKENSEKAGSSTLDHKEDNYAQISISEEKAASEQNEENEKTANDESGEDKVLKKPDKIIPCPRCNSMDTKFCYYNNYNINQPRHFCKNCQRYWTAGGSMRNVPVGAGRRKSKNSPLHYRQLLMAPDCLMGSTMDNTLNPEALASLPSIPTQSTSRNETVLKFGPEVPLCESMASVLNIEEQNLTNAGSVPRGEARDDNSCVSSAAPNNRLPSNAVHVDKNGAPVYCNGVGPVPQYYLGAPFMYPWGMGWNNLPVMVPDGTMPESASPSESCITSSAPWMNSPMMPGSRFPAPAFPYPLVPHGDRDRRGRQDGRSWAQRLFRSRSRTGRAHEDHGGRRDGRSDRAGGARDGGRSGRDDGRRRRELERQDARSIDPRSVQLLQDGSVIPVAGRHPAPSPSPPRRRGRASAQSRSARGRSPTPVPCINGSRFSPCFGSRSSSLPPSPARTIVDGTAAVTPPGLSPGLAALPSPPPRTALFQSSSKTPMARLRREASGRLVWRRVDRTPVSASSTSTDRGSTPALPCSERTPPCARSRARSTPPRLRDDAGNTTPVSTRLFLPRQEPLLQAPGSTPPRPPTTRRKTLAGGGFAFPTLRSSPRIQAKNRSTPIAQLAEALLCRRMGLVEGEEKVTEAAINKYILMFQGQLPAISVAALRALFRLDCDLATAVEEALLNHGGTETPDLLGADATPVDGSAV